MYTSCCYFPSAAQLPSLWAENKKSLLSMLVEVSNPLLEANCQEYVQWKLLSERFLHLLAKFLRYYFLIILFIFIYLFLAVLGLHWRAGFSLAGAGDSFSLQRSGFSLRGLILLVPRLYLEHRRHSCGTGALSPFGMRNLPGPGIEPESPALAGGRLTTEPAGKPQSEDVFQNLQCFIPHVSQVAGRFVGQCANVFSSTIENKTQEL